MKTTCAFFAMPRTSAGMGPLITVWIMTVFTLGDDFDSEIGNGVRKGAPDAVKATPNRHDTVAAIGSVSSLCIISAKCKHAFDIMSVKGGKKPLGDRFDSFVIFHIVSFYTDY